MRQIDDAGRSLGKCRFKQNLAGVASGGQYPCGVKILDLFYRIGPQVGCLCNSVDFYTIERKNIRVWRALCQLDPTLRQCRPEFGTGARAMCSSCRNDSAAGVSAFCQSFEQLAIAFVLAALGGNVVDVLDQQDFCVWRMFFNVYGWDALLYCIH